MAQPSLTLEDLGTKIAELTKLLSTRLKEANYPEPSFAENGPASLPGMPDIQIPRNQLVEAAMDLMMLASGPMEYLLYQGFWVRTPSCLSTSPAFFLEYSFPGGLTYKQQTPTHSLA